VELQRPIKVTSFLDNQIKDVTPQTSDKRNNVSQGEHTCAGNKRGLGDFSWLSSTGMMSLAPEPWALYPTFS